LVWVPGGLVPNTYYTAMLGAMQRKLQGKVDLWVSIVSCPGSGSPGGLCIPSFATANITAAFEAGKSASGISDAERVWFGGHSLGGVAADYHITHDNGTEIRGGAFMLGDYIFEGPEKLVNYPVPVLSLLGEVNFGSARPMKMAPYFAAAETAGEEALRRTPVVVVKDIDHSDMCEGFHVEGDLPSALPAESAVDSIAALMATYMRSQISRDEMSQLEMDGHVRFTREYMKPMNAALALDSHNAEWCVQMQEQLAAPFAGKVTISGRYSDSEWADPSAEVRTDGGLAITVTGRSLYETDNAAAWPPHSPWPFLPALRGALRAPPAVERNTPATYGCRLVSRVKIARLLGDLGERVAREPDNFCESANKAAWQWAKDNARLRTLLRYESAAPCNGCARAAKMLFESDSDASADFAAFANSSLGYVMNDDSLTVRSPVFVSEDEHACMLLSPSRALDFLTLDAYSASLYPAPASVASV